MHLCLCKVLFLSHQKNFFKKSFYLSSSKYFLECFFQDIAKLEKDWKIIALRYFNPVGAHHTGVIGEDPKGIPFNLMPYLAQVTNQKQANQMIYI